MPDDIRSIPDRIRELLVEYEDDHTRLDKGVRELTLKADERTAEHACAVKRLLDSEAKLVKERDNLKSECDALKAAMKDIALAQKDAFALRLFWLGAAFLAGAVIGIASFIFGIRYP